MVKLDEKNKAGVLQEPTGDTYLDQSLKTEDAATILATRVFVALMINACSSWSRDPPSALLRFHQCVRLSKFDVDREITFIPPDEPFQLMTSDSQPMLVDFGLNVSMIHVFPYF